MNMLGLIKLVDFCRPTVGVCVIASMLATYIPASQAALRLSGTRVVFDGEKRSTSLVVTNPGEKPFAVQTWVNTVEDDTTTPVPFISSPPLFRLNPGKQQQVQISGLPNNLPTDRESLFYFNVQEIPQADDSQGNVLNFALRTRIKFFYRPEQLTDNPVARLKDLQWSIKRIGDRQHLVVNNPTPFHVTFARLEVTSADQNQIIQAVRMAEPFSSHTYALDSLKPETGLQVVFSAINDYGGYTLPLTLPLQLTP